MTTRFKQKVRKWRGRTSHGGGHKKKRRGGGSQGGRGYGGSHKHKYSYITSKEPEHYGYKGFYSRKKRPKTVNIGDIDKMKEDDINLDKLGYGKLLGKGKISRPVTVIVDKASAKAMEKVEKAGGKVEIIKEKESDSRRAETKKKQEENKEVE